MATKKSTYVKVGDRGGEAVKKETTKVPRKYCETCGDEEYQNYMTHNYDKVEGYHTDLKECIKYLLSKIENVECEVRNHKHSASDIREDYD